MSKKTPYDLFETSEDLEAGQGVTIEYPGFAITIHRAGGSNKRYARVLAENMKPYRSRFERGLLDNETSVGILVKSFAQGVIVGWSGVKDKTGKNMKFNVENCIKLLTDLPDLYEDLKDQAESAKTFRGEQEALEEKNL